MLTRVAGALNQVPGRVLVVGHTDDQPLRSLRYRDNFELSRERAVSVVDGSCSATIDNPARLEWTGVGSSSRATVRSRRRRTGRATGAWRSFTCAGRDVSQRSPCMFALLRRVLPDRPGPAAAGARSSGSAGPYFAFGRLSAARVGDWRGWIAIALVVGVWVGVGRC